jgi:rRNA maturation RNase YbeY
LAFCKFCQKGRKKEKSTISFDDEYLHKINLEYLNHDTLTDVTVLIILWERNHGDIFISVERVQENAADFNVPLKREIEE